MLGQHHRCRANSKPALVHRLFFIGLACPVTCLLTRNAVNTRRLNNDGLMLPSAVDDTEGDQGQGRVLTPSDTEGDQGEGRVLTHLDTEGNQGEGRVLTPSDTKGKSGGGEGPDPLRYQGEIRGRAGS